MSQKTWGGRFEGGTDARVEAFTESISFDRRLYRQDIRGSQAHARMLAEVGLLSADDATRICAALDEIGAEIEAGRMEFSIALEDIHTHIERALIAKLGDIGRKLHTGRSRNDQVATDVKLWVRDAIDELDHLLADLQRAFVSSTNFSRYIANEWECAGRMAIASTSANRVVQIGTFPFVGVGETNHRAPGAPCDRDRVRARCPGESVRPRHDYPASTGSTTAKAFRNA